MQAHKTARIRELSSGVHVEEPPSPRIDLQPRFRIDSISKHDKALAESFLKREASAARGSQPLLRRVKSRLARPDRGVTLTTLCHHVQVNGAAEVAQIYIDRLALDAAQSALPFVLPESLLITAVNNANVNLVRLLAPYTAEDAVSAALGSAVLVRDRHVVTALLEYGADPNTLSYTTLFEVAETDLQLFQLILRAPKPLRHEAFANLCAAVVRDGHSTALSVLLRTILDYPQFRDSPPPWNRDSLLAAAIDSLDKSTFFSIADSTSKWPLKDNRLFFQVLDAPGVDRCLAKDMLEVLLCLSDARSEKFQTSSDLQATLCRCVQQQEEDIVRLMVSYGIPISAEPLVLACQNLDLRLLEILLAGNIPGDKLVVSRLNQLQGPAQLEMRQMVILRLLAKGAGGTWKHDELIRAVSDGQPNLVDALINGNASVDYHKGAALVKAVSLGQIPIVRKLLSRPVSSESLQAAFPSVGQLEILPRRLLTKLFINQGLTGECLDDALNAELCNYSYHRDPELVDMLINAGGVCNEVSLTVAFEHNDASTFDKIRMSRTTLDRSALRWFRDRHRVFFTHVQNQDQLAPVSLTCLTMLMSKFDASEDICSGHDGHRQYECFHQFLQSGAEDPELFSTCLKWMSSINMFAFTELLLTVACYCDTNRLHLVLRSRPTATPLPSPSSASTDRLSPSIKTSNRYAAIQVPPSGHAVSGFSDAKSAESLKIVFRQYFHDTWESHLATRLLKRHLEDCMQAIPEGEEWPILTTQFLLSQSIEVMLPEYSSCLYMAIATKQWLVLESLLDRQLPRDMLASYLLVDTASLTPSALRVLLESQAMSCMDDEFFLDVVQRAFNHACLAQDQEVAIMLCTLSRSKLSVTNILASLEQAIDVSEFEYISTLLSATTVSKAEIEVLWNHVCRQQWDNDFLTAAKILLKAGADGTPVARTLIDAVEKNDEGLLALLLVEWQALRLPQHRQEYDYQERKLISRFPDEVADTEYFTVLTRALNVAIRLDRATICGTLCAAGAALVFQGESLIELATVLGSQNSLMELVRYTQSCPDMNEAVNFALLQTVAHNRPGWIHDLVSLGGDIEAYELEAFKVAARLSGPDVLATLLSFKHLLKNPLGALYWTSQALQMRLEEPEADPDVICTMFEQLREISHQQPETLSHALLSLSQLPSAEPRHVHILVKCGASVEFRDGECISQAWKRGNARLFSLLFSHCKKKSIVARLLDEACNDLLQREPDRFVLGVQESLPIFTALLDRSVPQEQLDATLDSIARVCHDRPGTETIIRILLEKGAHFLDGAGASLYQVCRLEDPDIKSLVVESNPPLRTRFSALLRLFRNQGINPANHDLIELIQEPFNPSDHACLYSINFPASEAECLELEPSDITDLIGVMLNTSTRSIGTGLMFSFFFMKAGVRLFAPKTCSDEDRNEVEQLFVAAIRTSEDESLEQRAEFLLRVLNIDALNAEGVWSDTTGFALKEDALSRLLVLSLEHGKYSLVATLLEAGASPNAVNDEEHSALYLASLGNALGPLESLIERGAIQNDGSLHVATSRQHHEAMHQLLEAGHSRSYSSELFEDATPLEAFLRFDHSATAQDLFAVTLAVLLWDANLPIDFWAREPNILSLALMGSAPYEMISSVLDHFPPDAMELPLVPHDRFMMSTLSLVERGEHVTLSDTQRLDICTRLEGLGFTRTYYALEGDQPEDAANVPEDLEPAEIRAHRRAWREKDCAVCGDKPEAREDIHAALSDACADNHSWADDIICTDCLRGHLESQMFPQGNDKFPSAKVKCWAANCPEILTHSVLQIYTEDARFAVYDASLAQLCLNDGANTAKCAVPGCFGATWLDEVEDKDVTIIRCPVCAEETCIQCNQLYDRHRDEPCPQGEEAKGIERRREEEAATAALMAQGKKCPSCQLPYEKITGCDHIVCGKDAHSSGRSRGCGFEFCYLCGADFNAIRAQGNTAHMRSCKYYG